MNRLKLIDPILAEALSEVPAERLQKMVARIIQLALMSRYFTPVRAFYHLNVGEIPEQSVIKDLRLLVESLDRAGLLLKEAAEKGEEGFGYHHYNKVFELTRIFSAVLAVDTKDPIERGFGVYYELLEGSDDKDFKSELRRHAADAIYNSQG